jgi:spore coat polysaccharide biosynthesis protein SpsF
VTSQVRIILQARTSSNRLPAKVLLPIGGMPLAVLCARRLGSTGRSVILATSDATSDDLLVQTAKKAGINVFRGNLTNVLDRFIHCIADLDDDDIIVRATADNPLPNGAFIEILLKHFYGVRSDYLGTTWPIDGLPYGVGAEVMTVGAIRRASENTNDPYDCEHVTPWISREAKENGLTRFGWFSNKNLSHLRATIDTLDDYFAMESIFSDEKESVLIDWEKLCAELPKGETSPPKNIPISLYDENYSSITLGTAQFGMNYGITNRTGRPNDSEIVAILNSAMHAGVTCLDSARAYGDSEFRIGQVLQDSAKDYFKIATKLIPLDNLPDNVPEREITRNVDASVYGSCHDLRRDHINIMFFHRSSDMFRWRGAVINRLEYHLKQGVIRSLGVSVYYPDEAIKCIQDERITHLQIPFNILDSRWLNRDFHSALVKRPDVRVHVRSVFLQGLLINQASFWPDWFPSSRDLIIRIDEMVEKFGRKSKTDLCIAYVRSFSWVSSLVLGVETQCQLEELLSFTIEPVLNMDQTSFIQKSFVDIPERLLNPSKW